MSKVDLPIEKARALAGAMAVMNAFLIPLLVAAVGLPLIGELYLVTFEPAPWAAQLGPYLAFMIKLLSYAPAIAAVGAVIMLSPVLVEYHEGRFTSKKASAAFQFPTGVGGFGGALFHHAFVVIDPVTVQLRHVSEAASVRMF